MNIGKVISTRLESAKRLVKFLGFGKNDTKETYEFSPSGIDGNPIKNMRAVFTKTSSGKNIIIGYLCGNQKAGPGELRLYSVNDQGEEQNYTWLKKDGTIEIGGNSDFMVRYSKLETAFNELQQKFNSFAASYTPGSPSTLGTPAFIQQSTADISQAKIQEIKTK